MSVELPEGFAAPDSLVGPVTIRQRVAWGELDALGHVNHTVFLRWFENARFSSPVVQITGTDNDRIHISATVLRERDKLEEQPQ